MQRTTKSTMQLGITSSLSYPTIDRNICKVGMQFRVETSPFEERLCVSISNLCSAQCYIQPVETETPPAIVSSLWKPGSLCISTCETIPCFQNLHSLNSLTTIPSMTNAPYHPHHPYHRRSPYQLINIIHHLPKRELPVILLTFLKPLLEFSFEA